MDQKIQLISSILPCRETQIKELIGLLRNENEPFPECILIYGHTGTGKTSLIKELLQLIDINYAFMNLVEFYSNKILFESILLQLSGEYISKQDGYVPSTRCDNSMDFISNLNEFLNNKLFFPTIIVLDKVEFLRNDPILLSFFLRLQELSGLPICVIMISDIVFEKFLPSSLTFPNTIFFPQYSKEELLQILCLGYKASKNLVESQYKCSFYFEMDFYKNFINVFLSVFFRACRDLSELKYLAKINFLKYCQPILTNEIDKNDIGKLWKNIAPILKKNLEVVYLRINNISIDSSLKDLSVVKLNTSLVLNDYLTHDFFLHQESNFNSNTVQTLELPFYAKYLLIAAYLASYNPAKEDKRIFMKYHGKQRKTKRSMYLKSKVDDKLNLKLGPKQFTLDRLLAIFYAIVDERIGLTSNLLVQLSSLVELKLLMTIGNELGLNAHKYKCLVSFEFILTVSKMVGFNIKKYLYDLM